MEREQWRDIEEGTKGHIKVQNTTECIYDAENEREDFNLTASTATWSLEQARPMGG